MVGKKKRKAKYDTNYQIPVIDPKDYGWEFSQSIQECPFCGAKDVGLYVTYDVALGKYAYACDKCKRDYY